MILIQFSKPLLCHFQSVPTICSIRACVGHQVQLEEIPFLSSLLSINSPHSPFLRGPSSVCMTMKSRIWASAHCHVLPLKGLPLGKKSTLSIFLIGQVSIYIYIYNFLFPQYIIFFFTVQHGDSVTHTRTHSIFVHYHAPS